MASLIPFTEKQVCTACDFLAWAMDLPKEQRGAAMAELKQILGARWQPKPSPQTQAARVAADVARKRGG